MDRIQVTVRARPLSPDDKSPWKISGNSIFIPGSSSIFNFDRILGEHSTNSGVYEAHTKNIVSASLHGFNGTILAYGQTNSGKTHTMHGSAIEPGIIPLAVHSLFDLLERDKKREFLLRMSYMEIYNEEINDLLDHNHKKLQIHECPERGIYVAGLREEIVASPQQVLDLMQFAGSHLHIGKTNMNVYSSRSHTVFRMVIESRGKTGEEDTSNSLDSVRVSVLNMVDLAGSERAAKTGAKGVRLKEGAHINKSLLALGTVIKKLSKGAVQRSHVPYRDSKLTRILQSALGGNANTEIICNITLAQIHVEETKSSLTFASNALRVTNCARLNEVHSNLQDQNNVSSEYTSPSPQALLLVTTRRKALPRRAFPVVDEKEIEVDLLLQHDVSSEYTSPSPHALLLVTTRKALPRKRAFPVDEKDIEVDLLLQHETERITSEQNLEESMKELFEQQNLEKGEFLEDELSHTLSGFLAKEDPGKLRKEFEETKFKLKNTNQEKTKIEHAKAEKAHAEGEKTIDSNSKVFDAKKVKAKGPEVPSEQTMQEPDTLRNKPQRSKKLSLEDYLNFLHTEDPTRFTVNHLNQIIRMHGFCQIRPKASMIEALQHIDLMVPSRSTLENIISPSGSLTLEDAVSILDEVKWQEDCISSIQTLSSSPAVTVSSH